MTDDQNRSDARAGLRGPPEVSFLKAVSNFDGCRCCRWTRSAPATKRKIYRMHKRLSPQRDTGKPNQTKPKTIYKTGGRNMAAGRAQALTNLFNALDRVPADRRGTAIAAAEKYLQEIHRLEAAGATPEEIKAAGDRIRAEYKSDIES